MFATTCKYFLVWGAWLGIYEYDRRGAIERARGPLAQALPLELRPGHDVRRREAPRGRARGRDLSLSQLPNTRRCLAPLRGRRWPHITTEAFQNH